MSTYCPVGRSEVLKNLKFLGFILKDLKGHYLFGLLGFNIGVQIGFNSVCLVLLFADLIERFHGVVDIFYDNCMTIRPSCSGIFC